MAGRVRIGVGFLALAGLLAILVVRCTADSGDAAADLARARSLLDQTATRTGVQRAEGFSTDGIGACMDSFNVGRASMRYSLDLNGQAPGAVLLGIAEFWTESASGIVDVDLEVATDRTSTGEITRVSASGGDWWIAVHEQLGPKKGIYEFVADGPCTGNTKGSIGPAMP